MTTDEPLIEVSDLTKRYGDRVILDRVSLSVRQGETVALIGPSGGGKSTLLRSINALHGWDEGTVRVGCFVAPNRIRGRAARQTARNVRRLVGMVFQDFQLFPHRTAVENVMEGPLTVLGIAREDARRQALELLDRVGLADRSGNYPDQLSGGQKQRVAVARALAMHPRGLLCDEITSALDPEIKHEVLEVLAELKSQGLTLLMVTHEIAFTRQYADRVAVLDAGKLVANGPPADVLDNPASERLRQFLQREQGA